MSAELEIDRPIFIVGCGRSGTTILYELMSGHPDLGWFSTWSQRWPGFPQAAGLSHLRNVELLRRWIGAKLPGPVEGYPLWDHCKPVPDSPSDPPLTRADAGPWDIARIRAMVAAHLRYQRKPRFINKNTRNSRRVRFLDAVFPDALFIHIVRDPRATVNSLLRVDFWPDLKIWCEGKVTPRQWAAAAIDPAVLAARLWKAEVRRVLDDSAALPAHRYLQLRYEELTEHPADTLRGTLSFAGLEYNERFARFVAGIRVDNRNSKCQTQLSTKQIARIDEIVAPVAKRLGYGPYAVKHGRPQLSAPAGTEPESGRRGARSAAGLAGRTA